MREVEWERDVFERNYGVSEKSEEGEESEIVGDVWVSGSGHGVCGVYGRWECGRYGGGEGNIYGLLKKSKKKRKFYRARRCECVCIEGQWECSSYFRI